MDALRVFDLLRGSWRLTRTINGVGVVNGFATFTQIRPGEMLYREDGVFHRGMAFQSLKVYQEYVYCLNGDAIFVYFSENNLPAALLHKLTIVAADSEEYATSATARHLCKDDHYNAVYLFSDDKIRLEYHVNGPRKNYIMTTIFARDS